jgi:hypothetical protein
MSKLAVMYGHAVKFYVIIWSKKWIGLHFGQFFTNSSGHRESVPRVCVGRLASACVIYKEFVPWVRKQVI